MTMSLGLGIAIAGIWLGIGLIGLNNPAIALLTSGLGTVATIVICILGI